MNPEEVDNFRKKVEKETMDGFIDKISVNDSFFYAEMIIYEGTEIDDIFNQKVNIIIKMNLFNSDEFEIPNKINKLQKILHGKKIESKLKIDKEKLQSSEDVMMIIYDEVGKEIAKDLFQSNAKNINKTNYNIKENNRRYI